MGPSYVYCTLTSTAGAGRGMAAWCEPDRTTPHSGTLSALVPAGRRSAGGRQRHVTGGPRGTVPGRHVNDSELNRESNQN